MKAVYESYINFQQEEKLRKRLTFKLCNFLHLFFPNEAALMQEKRFNNMDRLAHCDCFIPTDWVYMPGPVQYLIKVLI